MTLELIMTTINLYLDIDCYFIVVSTFSIYCTRFVLFTLEQAIGCFFSIQRQMMIIFGRSDNQRECSTCLLHTGSETLWGGGGGIVLLPKI